MQSKRNKMRKMYKNAKLKEASKNGVVFLEKSGNIQK
jgi:hypothetical protein